MAFLTIFRIANCELVALPFVERNNPLALVTSLSVTSGRAMFVSQFVKDSRDFPSARRVLRASFAPYKLHVYVRGHSNGDDLVEEYSHSFPSC